MGHVDAAEVLLQRGASLKGVNNQGETPEHLAIWRNQFEVANLFRRKMTVQRAPCSPLRTPRGNFRSFLSAVQTRNVIMLQRCFDGGATEQDTPGRKACSEISSHLDHADAALDRLEQKFEEGYRLELGLNCCAPDAQSQTWTLKVFGPDGKEVAFGGTVLFVRRGDDWKISSIMLPYPDFNVFTGTPLESTVPESPYVELRQIYSFSGA